MVPDYYAMLGVEPDADLATIEAALARCQPKWSAGTRNPKNKHTFQSYLDQIPALRQALLSDPSSRAAYDAELRAQQRADRDRQFQDIQRLIRLRAAKGGLTVTDRQLLRKEAISRGLTIEDLDKLLEPIPPRAEAASVDDDAPDPPADLLDSATRRQIRHTLEHLRKRDLYEVLGIPRDAPAREILVRADEERGRWMRKTQVTAEKTAWLEAVSYAQSHLGNPAARARYDRTLVFEAEDAFQNVVRFALEGENRLEPSTRMALVDEAEGLGITADRADRLIRRTARGLGLAVDGVAPPPLIRPPRWLRCRQCGGVTDHRRVEHDAEPACRHCGDTLRWQCPSCQRGRWVDEPRCACGFPIELQEPMIRHFEAAQVAHRARNYAAALAHLHRVQEFAPQHVGTRKAVERVKQRLVEIEEVRSSFNIEFARRHLMAALEILRQWSKLVDPTSPELRRAHADVMRGLREARTRTIHAEQLRLTQPAEARRLFQEAMALVADLPEARDGLSRCPPDPPSDLRAEVVGTRVVLRWTPPAPDGLGPLDYVLVRRPKGIPSSSTDGAIVGQTTETELEDPGVLPGSVVGYAVFSRRGSLESTQGASQGPLLVLADVTDLRVEMTSGEVCLAWNLPSGAIGARVLRKIDQPPSSPDDGLVIEAVRDQAIDRSVQDNRVYHYGVFAVYRGPDGRPRHSAGVFVSAMPHRPLAPLPRLDVRHRPDNHVELSWPPPSRGQVRIARLPEPPSWRPGDQVSPAHIEAAGGHLLPILDPGQTIDPEPIAPGVRHYAAFTSWGGVLTAGPVRMFNGVLDPTDVRAARVGRSNKIHLRWRWTPDCPQSLIVARPGVDPEGPDDPQAVRQLVDEMSYSRAGHGAIELPDSSPGPWHIRVYAIYPTAGESSVSPGTEPSAQTIVPPIALDVTLYYTIRRPRLPGRPLLVQIRPEPPSAQIPPLVLVGHARTVPLGPDDGQVLHHFPASEGTATHRVRNRSEWNGLRLRVFLDPTVAVDQLSPVRIRHPEGSRTRV